MSFIQPIDPLLLNPQSHLCVDSLPESTREFPEESLIGLAALVQHPESPKSALRGLAAGMWAPGEGPGLYLHRQDFTMDGKNRKTRWSVIAGVDPERSPWKPAVSTHRQSVELHMKYLRRAGVDPVGITGIFRDEEHQLEKLTENYKLLKPLVSVRGKGEDHYSIWKLNPEDALTMIGVLESCKGAIIGDVALYRAIVALRDVPSFSKKNYPAVQFFNQRDFGITLASTARIYKGLKLSLNEVMSLFHQQYEVIEHPLDGDIGSESFGRFVDNVRMEGIAARVIGFAVKGVNTGFIIKSNTDNPVNLATGEPPEVALEFDSEWVERGLVESILPGGMSDLLTVLPNPKDSWDELHSMDEASCMFIVNPPPKRHISDLGEANWRLPTGSLQVRPPIPRGLMLCPFLPGEDLSYLWDQIGRIR